ncbi:hypothetical protein AAC387_Pa07g2145 [Persea americana]
MRNPSSVSKNPSLQRRRTFPREDNGVLGLLSEKSIGNGLVAALSLDRCSEENGGVQRLGILSEMRMERVLGGEIWAEISNFKMGPLNSALLLGRWAATGSSRTVRRRLAKMGCVGSSMTVHCFLTFHHLTIGYERRMEGWDAPFSCSW